MSIELIERLRGLSSQASIADLYEAADTIERQAEQIAELNKLCNYNEKIAAEMIEQITRQALLLKQCRKALLVVDATEPLHHMQFFVTETIDAIAQYEKGEER